MSPGERTANPFPEIDPDLLAEVRSAATFLATQLDSRNQKMGIVGFCMGGMYALLVEKKNSICKMTKVLEKEIAAHYRSEYRRMVDTGDTDFESFQ